MPRALLASVLLLAGCATPYPQESGVSFALLGDVPYSRAQVNLLDGLIDAMNAEPLAFVVHVGDITSGSGLCSDEWLEARARQFARIRHPFVLLPGDNEWADCRRTGFDPLERLSKWRSLFCRDDPRLALERQSTLDARFPEYCEHVRWEARGMLLVGLNVPGGNNNLGRAPETDAEHARRMRAALAWLEASAARAAARSASLVVLLHANPRFEAKSDPDAPDGYAPLRAALRALASRRPLVVAHGDTHRYRDDEPLPHVRRIEVDGSPFMSWLRATLRSDGTLGVERRLPQ